MILTREDQERIVQAALTGRLAMMEIALEKVLEAVTWAIEVSHPHGDELLGRVRAAVEPIGLSLEWEGRDQEPDQERDLEIGPSATTIGDLEQRNANLRRQVEELEADAEAADEDIQQLRALLSEAREELAVKNRDLATQESVIKGKGKELRDLQARVAVANTAVKQQGMWATEALRIANDLLSRGRIARQAVGDAERLILALKKIEA